MPARVVHRHAYARNTKGLSKDGHVLIIAEVMEEVSGCDEVDRSAAKRKAGSVSDHAPDG
jgi:hypothetical protein